MKLRPLRVPLLLSVIVVSGTSACATDGSFDFQEVLTIVSPRYRAEQESKKRDAEEKAADEAKAKAESEAEAAEVAEVAKMVPDAVAAKDLEKLSGYCSNGMGVSKSYDEAKAAACTALKEIGLARLTAAECGQVVTTWESVTNPLSVVGNEANNEGMRLTGERLAGCGQWDYLFGRLMHWGDGPRAAGRVLLQQLDDKGVPVEKEFLKFIGQRPKGVLGEYSANAMANYAEWRAAKGVAPTCKEHIAVASKFTGLESHRLIYLLVKMECRDAADVIVASLADPVPLTRERACVALADLGAKNKIDKMKILAEKDGAFKVERGVQNYWVRNTCNAAIGRLELAP